jgi:hypothetical protein
MVGGLAIPTRPATVWLIALLPVLSIALEIGQEFAPCLSTEVANTVVSGAAAWLVLLPRLLLRAALPRRMKSRLAILSPRSQRLRDFASIDDFDRHYRTNVRAPLCFDPGIVADAEGSHRSCSSIRAAAMAPTVCDVTDGVRVLNVYLGRTATNM